jgi:hypothetical protein
MLDYMTNRERLEIAMGRVEEIVRRHLVGVRAVRVREDINQDDEPILRVDVTYDPATTHLSAKEMSAVVEDLWDDLIKSSARSFPVVNFIEGGDMEEASAA